ncbi:unnamed protein product [Allacma fusca]|uniref:Uncharacterized protein n=1 Tax=Allacma fusca TaxID=39272 RepID=A0A8J2M5H1_9HEXA|nr:unnamed protein product [Allacma fusca]
MNVITKENFQKVRWSDSYEYLTIKGCLRQITSENISRSRKTLSAIKFVQLTSFLNIKLILENCSNLVRLSFSNVAIVQKSNFNSKTQPLIPLPHLEELEVQEWLYTLTKYEYWILDFLNRGCSFGKLEKFVFQGRENFMDEKKVGRFQKHLRGIIDPTVVTKFLIKNSSTLKKVSIGGIGFQLVDSTSTRFGNQMARVQLNSFRFDLQTPGVDLVLLSQRRLQTLSCTGFLQSFELRAKQWIIQSLDCNYITLTFLGIFPCIISDVAPDKRTSLYTIDCDIFRRCKKLESLFLNISTVHRKNHTERFSCGRIVNIHLLPVCLVEIELYAMKFQEQDVDDLCKRLPMFRRLRELVLNSPTSYTLSTVLVSNLPLVDSLHHAKFFGGQFDDPDTMQRIIKKRGVYTLTIGENTIEVLKNDSAHPSMSVSYKSSVSDKKIVIK